MATITNEESFNKENGFCYNKAEMPMNVFLVDLKHIHYPKETQFIPYYTKQKFSEVIKSVKAHGMYYPIIVRQISDNNYEILGGKILFEAAKYLQYEKINARILKDVSADEAKNILNELKLLLPSTFEDLSHSQKAFAIHKYYDGIKDQGRRTDRPNKSHTGLLTVRTSFTDSRIR